MHSHKDFPLFISSFVKQWLVCVFGFVNLLLWQQWFGPHWAGNQFYFEAFQPFCPRSTPAHEITWSPMLTNLISPTQYEVNCFTSHFTTEWVQQTFYWTAFYRLNVCIKCYSCNNLMHSGTEYKVLYYNALYVSLLRYQSMTRFY